MLRRFRKTIFAALLPMMMSSGSHAAPLAPYPTATLTVNGAETSINSVWDNGPVTIDFNGFVETVNYGQFSTPASLASGLAAMFTRDYIAMGLYAKAGAHNNQDPMVITFQLATGATFGPINIVGSAASFSFTPSGFASSTATADQGIATLSFNGATIATSNYGDGSTGASIAQDLALKASSSLVTVTSKGSNLLLQSTQTTGSFNYSYNLSFSTSASFSSTPSSGQLTSSTNSGTVPVYNYVVNYDSDSNVNGLADSVMGTWTYGYDSLNRLTSGRAWSGGSYAGQYTCWSYDNFGNRTHQSLSNQPFVNAVGQPCQSASGASLVDTAVSYSANNQISSATSPAITVAYDGAGNTTADGFNTYTYDAEGRVCALNGPQGMIGYQYDADGKRIGKGTVTNWQSCDITANGYIPTTDFVLDQGGSQMSEVSVGGGVQTWEHTNVTANGMLIATFDALGQHFYLNDALGSRRVQTDTAGIPEQTCQSLPFGDQLYCSGSLDSPTEHHFTGKERDSESGLDYFGARYYGSNMGRFNSPDGFSDGSSPDNPQSWNLYSYVQNNPLTNTDPDGHDCVNTSNYSTDGTVTVTSGTSCASDPAKYGTYVNGTVDPNSITASSKPSGTTFGYNFTSYDGQSGGAGVITQAAPYEPLESPADRATAGMIGNGGMQAIGVFTAGSVVGGVAGGALLATGVIGGETGATLAGVGRSGASVGNRLWHIFGNPEHGLGALVAKYGSQLAAYSAILNAAQAQITATGNFVGVAIQVGGMNIQVNGTVIDGVVKISTAYIGK